MTQIGGYQIIDLLNKSLGATAVVIPGIYEKIEGSIKPLLFTGITVGSTKYKDAYIQPLLSSDGYYFLIGSCVITINDNDEITAETL